MFTNEPICEVCGKNKAISFSHFDANHNIEVSAGWKFVCMCTNDIEDYDVLISGFFDNPASTVDWLAHLKDKPWMDSDDFLEMIQRFRTSTASFGKLVS